MLGSLNVVVEHLYDECLGRHIFLHIRIDLLTNALALIDGLLHHAATHGGHLGTMLRIDDRGHDVATEGRTDLIEQVLIDLTLLLVLIRANLQLGAVSSQTRGQR